MKSAWWQRLMTAALIFFSMTPAFAGAPGNGVRFSDPLDLLAISAETSMRLDVGIGSGACRQPSDPQGIIYTITDRGPNIKTKDALKLLGIDFGKKKGKIFPTPNFAPTIYKLRWDQNQVTVLDKIQIKTPNGTPISGISNPDTEPAWDIEGKSLAYDPAGLDAEGIVKLKDGTFWVGEEYGPSILHIAADGRVMERWVPQGVKASLAGTGYMVKEILPALLRKRPLNRGIESITATPDEKYLYFAMQSPLAHPDKAAYLQGRPVRVFKIDRQAAKCVGEFVYPLDSADSFGMDNQNQKRKQNAVKVSELTAIDTDRLVVLERISKTTKFYLVDLQNAQNILGSPWDLAATAPSLEQNQAKGIRVLDKKLLLNTDDLGGLMKKIEGLAWMGGDHWIMVNDNDFGITADPTYIVPVRMPVP